MTTEILLQSLLTVEQVARRLAIQETTVRQWLREGILPGIKINSREWRIDPVDLEAFIEKRKRRPEQR